MNTSTNGLAFIAKEEGEVLHEYRDSVGVRTIGVGHAMWASESYPNGITHEQAMTLLQADVEKAEDTINDSCHVELNQNEFDALVSFTFNVGVHALMTSTLLVMLNTEKRADAADQFLRWDKAGGKSDPVLAGRRARERALFLQPVEQTTFLEGPQEPETKTPE